MYCYSLHLITCITPKPKAPTQETQHRVDIEWSTPIEYASDVEAIEAHLVETMLSEWREKPANRNDQDIHIDVQVLNWQPLKGTDRPAGK